MRSPQKTPFQVEFADLMHDLGWRAVDAARMLKLSKSYVSLILKGDREPSERLMDSFRRTATDTLAAQGRISETDRQRVPVESYRIEERDPKDAQQKLAQVAKTNPRAFDSIRLIIDSFAAQPGPNSAEAVARATAGVRVGADGVAHLPAAPAPKPGADAPTARKAAPAVPAPLRPTAKRPSPKPAPAAPES